MLAVIREDPIAPEVAADELVDARAQKVLDVVAPIRMRGFRGAPDAYSSGSTR